MFFYLYVACQPDFIMLLNSVCVTISGVFARLISNLENAGGFVDGNTQLPIFNGAVVDINNSPDTVRPKLSYISTYTVM